MRADRYCSDAGVMGNIRGGGTVVTEAATCGSRIWFFLFVASNFTWSSRLRVCNKIHPDNWKSMCIRRRTLKYKVRGLSRSSNKCIKKDGKIIKIVKTFYRLRHRDKLTTDRLGWLGSATYSRIIFKRECSLIIGFGSNVVVYKDAAVVLEGTSPGLA